MRAIAKVLVIMLITCAAGTMADDNAYARGGGHGWRGGGNGPRVGIGFWVGPGWWPYYYPSYYYPNYYSPTPPIVIQQHPDVYAEPPQQEQQLYWYYCKEPQGYYPYIKECPSGWMKVVPTPPAPENEE